MTKTVNLISPIDGSVYLTREVLTQDAAFAAAKRAKAAQPAWAATSVAERIAMVRKAAEIIGSQQDRMTTEIAHQMGRPIRYGGEFGGVNERLTYMADVAEEKSPNDCTYCKDNSQEVRRIKPKKVWRNGRRVGVNDCCHDENNCSSTPPAPFCRIRVKDQQGPEPSVNTVQ